jgi:hypothetical protein
MMPRRGGLLALLWLATSPVWADWQWLAAEDVAPPEAGVFQHLDASGRQAMISTPAFVALAWSDAGQPRCYLSFKEGSHPFISHPFGKGDCFDPSMGPVDEHRVLIAWEDSGGVQVAIADTKQIYAPTTVAPSGGQAVIRNHPKLGVLAVWSSTEAHHRRIFYSHLTLQGNQLVPGPSRPVDANPATDDQMFPAIADTQDGLTLIWEDRRLGHTVIFGSLLRNDMRWSPPQRISHNRTGKINNDLGRGAGAMRPALASYGVKLAAVWLDKSDFLSGYDVYGSFSEDQGKSFGANLKLQDSFGDAVAQWHAGVAGNAQGSLVVAWDDDRDGTSDIWLTWPKGGGFAADTSPNPASGPPKQTDPVVWLDDAGNLHLAWIEQIAAGTRIRYSLGKPR